MNRYEALSAPPSLSSKDLSLHIRMQAAISQEVRNACSLELLNPKVKLTDELTTARFARPLPEGEPAHYRAMIRHLACGGRGEPIPYRFFAAEYDRTVAPCGVSEKPNPTARDAAPVLKALLSLEDAWRLQAWAAQFLRVAVASETQDAGKAGEVWDRALSFYRRFFARARAEESYAFQYQTDPAMRDACVAAWNDFLPELVRGIEARLKAYIRDKNAAGIASCLDALGGQEARSVDPGAYARALADSFLPILHAIENAPNLLKAVELYEGCPAALRKNDEKQDLVRSLLSAMGREAELLEKGFGDAKLLITWMEKLDAARLYREGTSTIKGSARALFENCRSYLLSEINAEKEESIPAVLGLLRQMPPDLWVARHASDVPGEPPTDLYRDDVLGLLLPRRVPGLIRALIPKGPATTAKAREAGRAVCREAEGLQKGSRYADAVQAAVAVGLNTLKGLDAPGDALAAFLEAFPDDTPLGGGDVKTVGELKRGIAGDPRLKALVALQQSECGSEAQLACAQAVIKAAKESPDVIVQGEPYGALARHGLLNAFVENANAYSGDPSRKLSRRIMELIAAFLPDGTQVPGGEGKLTVRSLMDNLDFRQLLQAVHAAQGGSQQEMDAVRALIRYVYDHPGQSVDGERLEDVAVKLMTQIFIGNANRVGQDRNASISRDILDVIADFLPENTRLPNEAGEKLTPGLLMARTDGISLLLRLRETADGTDDAYVAACQLIRFLEKGPASFKVGGERFETIAKGALIQVLVKHANLFMERHDSAAGRILVAILAFLPGDTPLPSGGKRLTVSAFIEQLGRMGLERIDFNVPNVPERRPAKPVPRPEKGSAPKARADAKKPYAAKDEGVKPAKQAAKKTAPRKAKKERPRHPCEKGAPVAAVALAARVRFVLWSLLIPFALLCAAEYFFKTSRTLYPLPLGSTALTGFLVLWALWLLGGLVSAAGDKTPFLSRCFRWQLLLAALPLTLMAAAIRCGFSPFEGAFRIGFLLYLLLWGGAGIALSASAAKISGRKRPVLLFLKRTLAPTLPLLAVVALLWRFGWLAGLA